MTNLPEKLVINIGPQPTPIIQPRQLDLVPQDHPVLHEPCQPAPLGPMFQEENVSLANCLLKVCAIKNGFGLSANQLGVNRRLFVLMVPSDPRIKIDQAYFNPEIIGFSDELTAEFEACISLPYILHKVERPRWVILKWHDALGNSKQETFYGITARVICHEMDHLNGITLFDHMTPLEKRRAREKQSKMMKKATRQVVKR